MRFRRAGQARGGRKGGRPARERGAVLSRGGQRESSKTIGSHDRSGNGLSGHVAKAMTADGGSLRVGWLNGRARGGCGRYGYRVGAGRSCKGGKIVKQRSDERQRQPECQRPAPKAPTCGFAHDRLRGEAGGLHRKPLRTDEISRLWRRFQGSRPPPGGSASADLGGRQRAALAQKDSRRDNILTCLIRTPSIGASGSDSRDTRPPEYSVTLSRSLF